MTERIKSVEFSTVRVPMTKRAELNMSRGQPNWCIAEVCAVRGESGLVGWGETLPHYTWGRPDRQKAESLVGTNPFDALWDDALGAGLQMALWDLAGKLVGAPSHRLMGTRVRDSMPIAWWCMDMTAQEWAAEAKDSVAAGYTAMKIKGRPWFDLSEQLAAISAVTPPDFGIDVDFNAHLNDLGAATPLLSEMERRFERLAIWETPIPQADVEGNRLLRSRMRLPIAMHFGVPPFPTAVTERVCDGFVIGGGAARIVREASLAAEFNKPFWLQLVGTGLTTAWALQLSAVLSHARWPTVTCLNVYTDDLLKAPLQLGGGYMRIPEGPGLGVEPDLDALERYRVTEGTTAAWPRRIYTVRWQGAQTVHYGAYRQYVEDFLMGNRPLFETGVGLSMRDDDGSAAFAALWKRACEAPVVETA